MMRWNICGDCLPGRIELIAMTRVYEEIVDFIAGGSTPDDVADWAPSEEAKALVQDLLRRSAEGTLSAEDELELNHYLELEHLMRLAKAKARMKTAGNE